MGDITRAPLILEHSVILVSGPTHLQVSHALIKVINVVSAEEM
jgi:hypothetical protein